jgi:hypothetical protein
VAKEKKRKHNPKAGRRRAETYDPVRLPRLKGVAQASPDLEPPPLPASVSAAHDGFGAAAEDGLRMLAAIETMDSLEPDFSDDPAGEASVTIIERSPFDAAEPRDTPPSLQGAARRQASASDSGSGERPTYLGPLEEAVVEIFEGPGPAPVAAGPRRQKSRPVGRRFFKALTGGDGG